MRLGALSSSVPVRLPFWAALPMFVCLAALGVVAYRLAPPQPLAAAYWVISAATLALWAGMGLTALWHAPADRRVRLFAHLVARADAALYAAKRGGRNQVR